MEDAFSVPFILSWLPLYYSHFVIAEFSQYKYFMDQVAIMLKSGNKKTFPSHLVFETDMLRYRAKTVWFTPGGVLPYKGLIGTSGRPGYVSRDFCLKQGIDFIIFCLNQGIDFINFFLKLDCLQSAFSLKIRPDETRKDSLWTDVPPPSEKKNVSFFFFSGLRPRFSPQAASTLACLGFACSNFAKKNNRLLAV